MFVDAVISGKRDYDLITDDTLLPQFVKYHKVADRIRSVVAKHSGQWNQSRVPLEVIIHQGRSGTGKTRQVYLDNESVDIFPMFSYKPEWWDGFEHEPIVLFDEFVGQIPVTRMLRLLDNYPLRLPVKCGSTCNTYKKIYFCSNVNWDEWWPDMADEHKDAFRRRITQIINFN